MPVYVAFLRGINVGGNKKIAMAALKTAFERLSFAGVRTHLNSGNVIFATEATDRAKLAAAIGSAIETEFGFRPSTILRDNADLRKIVAGNPFPAMAKDDPSHLVVMLLAEKPGKDAARRLAEAYRGVEVIRIAGADAYISYPNGIGTSKLTNALLEKALGVAGTARNWNTIGKLLTLTAASEA